MACGPKTRFIENLIGKMRVLSARWVGAKLVIYTQVFRQGRCLQPLTARDLCRPIHRRRPCWFGLKRDRGRRNQGGDFTRLTWETNGWIGGAGKSFRHSQPIPGWVWTRSVRVGMRRWQFEDKVARFYDFDQLTGTYNEELRFALSIAEELNKYLVCPWNIAVKHLKDCGKNVAKQGCQLSQGHIRKRWDVFSYKLAP